MMSDDDAWDEIVSQRLLAYDEALDARDAHPSSDVTEASLSATARARLRRARRCIDALEALRRGLSSALPPRLAFHRAAAEASAPQRRRIGRFHLLEQLGVGAFGIVYRAWDPLVDRELALKIPRPELLGSAEAQARFEQEARAAAKLDHPHIVPVLEAGIADLVPYIASVFCPGVTLGAWLAERRQPVGARAAAELVRDLAEAAAHSHARGVLHRDIKPSNVLLISTAGEGPIDELSAASPKLMDFGLAKLADGIRDMTRSGTLLGTIRYMSPEQAAGRTGDIGPGSDVYSLGAVLYELLAGEAPFAGTSDLESLRRIAEHEPSGIRPRRPDTPRDLETIALKSLEKDPRKRYPTARALADDLDRYLNGMPVQARQPNAFERLDKWSRRNPALAGLFLVVALASMALVAGLIWSNTKIAAALAAAQTSEQQAGLLLYTSDLQLAQRAMDSNEIGRALEILKRYQPLPGRADSREFGWHFLWRTLNRQVAELPEHPGDVYAVACSPDGRTIVTVCRDGKVRFWAYPSLKFLGDVGEHRGEVGSAKYSFDGKLLATGGDDGAVIVWDAATHKSLRTLRHGSVSASEEVGGLAFSPDASRLYVAAGVTLYCWDVQRGALMGSVLVADRAIRSLDLSSDGRRIAVTAGDTTLYDAASLARVGDVSGPRGPLVSTVRFYPDQARLALGYEGGAIAMYDLASNERIRSPRTEHTQQIHALALSGDGRYLASGGADRLVQVFDANSGDALATLQHHAARVWDVQFLPDNSRLITSAADGQVCFWSVPSDARYCERQGYTSRLFADRIRTMAYSVDGRFVACGGSLHKLYVLDRSTDRVTELEGREITTGALLLSEHGDVLVQSNGNGLTLWNTRTTAIVDRWSLPEEVGALAWSPKADCIAVQQGATAVMLEWPSGRRLRSFGRFERPLNTMRFSSSGKQLMVSLPGRLAALDVATGEPTMQVGKSGESFEGFALLPDGQRMVVAEGLNGVTIRAVKTGEILQRLPGHPGNVREVAAHPNGRNVASVCDRHVLRIWDLTTGQPVLSFDDCQVGRRSAMDFCPTGDELGFVQDRGAHQLNFIDGSLTPYH